MPSISDARHETALYAVKMLVAADCANLTNDFEMGIFGYRTGGEVLRSLAATTRHQTRHQRRQLRRIAAGDIALKDGTFPVSLWVTENMRHDLWRDCLVHSRKELLELAEICLLRHRASPSGKLLRTADKLTNRLELLFHVPDPRQPDPQFQAREGQLTDAGELAKILRVRSDVLAALKQHDESNECIMRCFALVQKQEASDSCGCSHHGHHTHDHGHGHSHHRLADRDADDEIDHD